MQQTASPAPPPAGPPVAVVVVDGDERIVGMNAAGAHLFATTVDEAVGRPAADLAGLARPDGTSAAGVRDALDRRGVWRGTLVLGGPGGDQHRMDATFVRAHEPGSGRPVTYRFLTPSEPAPDAPPDTPPEGRFRSLFEHLPEALLVQHLDGRIVEANASAAELYGVAPGALAGRHVTEITADVNESLLAAQHAYLRQHGSLVAEATGRRPDGTTFPQRVTITLVEVSGRELVFVLSRDLTEQRRLERALAALTDMGRLHVGGDSLESFADAAVALTLRMFDADRGALAAFHGDEVEWLGQRRMERFIEAAGSLRPSEVPWLRQPLELGIPVLQGRTEPGRAASEASAVADALHIRAFAIVPLRSSDELIGALGLVWSEEPPPLAAQLDVLATVGRLVGMAVGNLRLRDSLVTRQRELDESEARYRGLFEEAPQPLIIEAWDGHILDANEAAARLYGRPRAELIGLEAGHVGAFDPDAAPAVAAGLRERRRMVYRDHGRRADGTTFPQEVEIAIATIRGDESLLVQVRDRTDEERLQGELLQAQKMDALGQLIAGVAHELNNPLSAIVAFSQLMRGDDRLPADVHRDAELLMQEADRTRRIVQNLLDFARQRPPERRSASIRDLIERTLDLHTYALGMGRISVEQRYPDALPLVDVDPGQIQQVLLSLTVNAIQAIRSVRTSGTLVVEVTLSQAPDAAPGSGFLRVSLTDDGPGVPEAIRGRLFEPFFTTREVGQGTGLGLSVSYGIVASHGGRLWYEPAPDGTGSRFAFELPARWAADAGEDTAGVAPTGAAPAGSAGHMAPAPPAGVARGGVILAVDDEPSIRAMLGRILGRAGHDVTVASSGADALEILRRLAFDIVLVDHRMSGMNGLEFYEQAVALRPELRHRTVIMSGDVLDRTLCEFAVQRRLRVLAKPFDLDELQRIVGDVITDAA